MDAVAASGIITFLSAGNQFGGATFAGCNTIDGLEMLIFQLLLLV